MISRRRFGLSGKFVISIPKSRKAPDTAFPITAPTPAVPPSPPPFTSRGLSGDRSFSKTWTSTGGISKLDGNRVIHKRRAEQLSILVIG